jgi:6-pyruvoyltetrahydropterin/6-carboxytetrahydropterin synthase
MTGFTVRFGSTPHQVDDAVPSLLVIGKMQETFTEFSFEAAHMTRPFATLHGHTFTVRLTLVGEPDPVYGWTHNLNQIHVVLDDLKALVDHRYLNEIPGLEVPSLENVSRWMYNYLSPRIPGVAKVSLFRGQVGNMEGCVYSGEG